MPGCTATKDCMPIWIPLLPRDGKKQLGDLGLASGAFDAIFKMTLLAMALSGSMTPWFGERDPPSLAHRRSVALSQQSPAPRLWASPLVSRGPLPAIGDGRTSLARGS